MRRLSRVFIGLLTLAGAVAPLAAQQLTDAQRSAIKSACRGDYQNAVTGGSGGAVKTQGGDVYAGHDGNVYKHTDSGWSKSSDGGWNPVQPPANRPSPPASSSNTLGAAQDRGSVGASNSAERGNYQQLEQDRLGRQAGGGRWSGSGEQLGAREGGTLRGRH